MASDLRHVFMGSRYVVVDRPVRLSDDSRTVTDIDAAVLDVTTGTLALFQLKWQDFDGAELRERRSKARNFAEQVQLWAARVSAWIHRNGTHQLCRALRLESRSGPIKDPFLFALGRNSARFQSLGVASPPRSLATATWQQFVRLRIQIGAVDDALGTLHARLCEERAEAVVREPTPFSTVVLGQAFRFEDIWNTLRPRNATSNEVA